MNLTAHQRRVLEHLYNRVATTDEESETLELLLDQNVEGKLTDTERLDFLIENQAWVQWTTRDGSITQCQVWDQDPDEEYHILSGDDRYFNTPREAIDAAIAFSKGSKK